ncbi:unnamed protein product [Alternaria alternata]
MSTGADWISQHDLLRIDYAMLAMTSTVFVARIGVQAWRRKPIEAQDILLYIAFAAYLAFTILYIVITPIFFKIQELQLGRIVPWPTMMKDVILASRVMWQSGIEYWTCLWFVKFSLLALYKKLLSGMPKKYLYIWWGTLIFCVVTWSTCIITGPGLACNDTKAFFDKGAVCSSPEETRRQTANLYYAYAVDTVTNMMAVIIGCCPVLASVVPKRRTRPSDTVSYDTQGYIRQSPNRSGEGAPRSHGLRNILSSKNREKSSEKNSGNISISRTGHESEEELPPRRTEGAGILITDEIREQYRLRMKEDQRMEEARLKLEQSQV